MPSVRCCDVPQPSITLDENDFQKAALGIPLDVEKCIEGQDKPKFVRTIIPFKTPVASNQSNSDGKYVVELGFQCYHAGSQHSDGTVNFEVGLTEPPIGRIAVTAMMLEEGHLTDDGTEDGHVSV